MIDLRLTGEMTGRVQNQIQNPEMKHLSKLEVKRDKQISCMRRNCQERRRIEHRLAKDERKHI